MGFEGDFIKLSYILSYAGIKTCTDSLIAITLKEIDRK